MPILSGSASLTRFNVHALPDAPGFDDLSFREIAPGSEVRESIGFLPVEPGEPYEASKGRFAFRVRMDRLAADPTAVAERLKALIKAEREITGAPAGAQKRRQLKELAQEELLVQATPRSRIVEGVIDDGVLYLGTTANTHLGRIVQLLRRIGILVDFKTPWLDLGEEEASSEILELADPVLSAHGSAFLAKLLDDPEIKLEPVAGYARLQTRHARVTLSGAVLREVLRYVEEGAEMLAAKLLAGERSFTLDALAFRIRGATLERSRAEHWTEVLDERLEQIRDLWDLLDRRYAHHRRAAGSRSSMRVVRLDQARRAAETGENTTT